MLGALARTSGWIALAALLASLAACRKEDAYACPSGLTCIRVGNVADPGTLDPAHSVLKMDQTVIDDLLLGLTTFDAEGRPIPGLATDWTVSGDKRTWTFRLRPALWSDGEPITASDVVFSMRRLADPATAAPYATLLAPIENAIAIIAGTLPPDALGVHAPDPATVVITLHQPTPYLPDLLAHYGVLPVPEHAVRRWGDAWATPEHYVASGPFQLVSWRLGDRIVLARNPRFYDTGGVCLDRVEYYPITDPIVAEHRVKSGGLDINTAFSGERLSFLRGPNGMPGYVHIHPWTDLVYVVFRTTDPALADVRVRLALDLAIDRAFIADKLLAAGQQAVTGAVPPALEPLGPVAADWAHEPLADRQARARALLAEAGYTKDRPLRFTLKSSRGSGNLPVVVQADWREIGVRTTLEREDTTVFFNDLALGDFQVGFTDWIADFPDASDFLDLLRGDRGENYAAYDDPEYDRMLQQAEDESDSATRATLLQAAERRILQDAPIASVFANPSHNLVDPRVTGWQDNINDVHPMRWACFAGHALASNSAAR